MIPFRTGGPFHAGGGRGLRGGYVPTRLNVSGGITAPKVHRRFINELAKAKALANAGRPHTLPNVVTPGAASKGSIPGNNATKPKYNPFKVIGEMEPGKILTPKQMRAYANALAVIESRPEIHGYKQIAHELGEEREQQAEGLRNLGARTSGNVSSFYKSLAQSEAKNLARENALGAQLNQRSQAIANEGSQSLTDMQKSVLGEEAAQHQLRGSAPGQGVAQQALANAVASQQATQASDAQAAEQFAASQGATTSGLLAGEAGAAQMQGGSMVGQIGRDIIGRTAESNQKFNANIQTALGKLGEAKASLGAKKVKNLGEIEESQNKLKLGLGALAGSKAKLGLEGQKFAEEQRQNQIGNRISQQNANTSETSAKASMMNAITDRYKAEHPNQSSSSAQSHAIRGVKEVRAALQNLVPQALESGHKLTKPGEIGQLIDAINSKTSDTYAPLYLIRHVVQHWLHNREAKENATAKHIGKKVGGIF